MSYDHQFQFQFHDHGGIHQMDAINFLEGKNTFYEKVEFKINVTKKAFFDSLVASIENATGIPKPAFHFASYIFNVHNEKVFVSVRYDLFGSEAKPSGKYTVSMHSEDYDLLLNIKKDMKERFAGLDVNSVTWAISTPNGGIIYKAMDISGQHHTPKPSFYPWLNSMSLQDYYDGYLASEENILLLMGVPGTGKTTFIKDFLIKNRLNSVITYDERLMRDDNFFLDFIMGNTDDYGSTSATQNDVLIIEDADVLIEDREKTQNSILAKILNVSDGLIKNINKKIVFSTNITDLDRVDPALIRPGRCYDVLDFRKLTFEESERVIADQGSDRTLENRSHTLAELLTSNPRDQYTNKNKIGFGFRG